MAALDGPYLGAPFVKYFVILFCFYQSTIVINRCRQSPKTRLFANQALYTLVMKAQEAWGLTRRNGKGFQGGVMNASLFKEPVIWWWKTAAISVQLQTLDIFP